VLAASFASCASDRFRVASSFVIDPAFDDYRPVLRALIETILPREFPLDVTTVEQRLLRMFPLEDERRFLGLQRTLMYFDQLDLAPHVAEPLLAAERIALDVPSRLSEQDFRIACRSKIERETNAWPGRLSHFADLDPDERLTYLRVWSTSEFTVKRDFAQTLRILVMVAAYSSDVVWRTIGYEGPLLDRPERKS
jgi:hypothetical protein